MDRGAWWATLHGVTKELDTTEQLTFSVFQSMFSNQNGIRLEMDNIMLTEKFRKT